MSRIERRCARTMFVLCALLLLPSPRLSAQGEGGWPVSLAGPIVHSPMAGMEASTVKTPLWWLQIGDGGDGGWINVPGGGGGGHHLIRFVAVIPEGGGITFVLANGGTWSASVSAAPTIHVGTQGLTVGFNDPGITTKWHSAKGDHEVYTPCAGATPAAMKRCVDEHQQMVAIMQAIYPPI